MFRKVLFPTDFSEGSLRAVRRFEAENDTGIRELIVLHVVDEGVVEELLNGYSLLYKNEERELKDVEGRLKENAMKKLSSMLEDLRKSFKADSIRPVVRFGFPWEEIVKVAEEEDVSLIILPSHGKLGFSRELLGSTTVRVLRKTKKPVLIIKTHEGDGE